jgi:hypothetical protein
VVRRWHFTSRVRYCQKRAREPQNDKYGCANLKRTTAVRYLRTRPRQAALPYEPRRLLLRTGCAMNPLQDPKRGRPCDGIDNISNQGPRKAWSCAFSGSHYRIGPMVLFRGIWARDRQVTNRMAFHGMRFDATKYAESSTSGPVI